MLDHKLGGNIGIRSALLLVLVVGVLVRLPNIGRDVWFDEASSLYNARGADVITTKIVSNGPEFTSEMFARDGGWRESLLAISHAEYMPPLYFFLLRIWIKLFGEGDATLRLLSVIFGLATIIAVFFLGRKLFDEKIGLVAAGVMAILPSPVQYSQEIRSYPLAILLVTLASSAFWEAYRAVGERREWRRWLLYFGLAAASLYTHYFTAWVFLAHGMFAFAEPRLLRNALVKRLTVVAGALVVCMLPWLVSPYFKDQLSFSTLGQYATTFWESQTLMRLFALVSYLFAGYLPEVTFKSLFGLGLLVLYLIGALRFISTEKRKTTAGRFSLVLLVAPILSMIVLSAVMNRAGLIAHPKFILPALPGVCLVLAVAIGASSRRALSLLAVILLIGVSLNFQLEWHRANTSDAPLPGMMWLYGNVSSAVARVNQQAKPGELILFDDQWLPAVWNVYQKTRQPQMLMGPTGVYLNPAMDFDERWQQVERKYSGIHLVRRVGSPSSQVVERLEARYRLVGSEQVGRMEVRHYAK
jgi:uncharacterized membrane protein